MAGNSGVASWGVGPRDLGVLLAVMFEEAFAIEEGISRRNVCECRRGEADSFLGLNFNVVCQKVDSGETRSFYMFPSFDSIPPALGMPLAIMLTREEDFPGGGTGPFTTQRSHLAKHRNCLSWTLRDRGRGDVVTFGNRGGLEGWAPVRL